MLFLNENNVAPMIMLIRSMLDALKHLFYRNIKCYVKSFVNNIVMQYNILYFTLVFILQIMAMQDISYYYSIYNQKILVSNNLSRINWNIQDNIFDHVTSTFDKQLEIYFQLLRIKVSSIVEKVFDIVR